MRTLDQLIRPTMKWIRLKLYNISLSNLYKLVNNKKELNKLFTMEDYRVADKFIKQNGNKSNCVLQLQYHFFVHKFISKISTFIVLGI